MKHLHIFASLAACAVMCCCATFSIGASKQRTVFPDNAFQEIPQDYFNEIAKGKGGTIEKFTYKTRDNQTAGSKEFEKHALVYLPAGYNHKDKTQKYDVMYLMHGGSDSPEWFFGGEGKNTKFKNIIDHMIADGKTKPLIVCAVSYYTQYSNDATKNCIDFYYELNKDVIPVFETKYHTFARNVTQAELDATRGHRAFSGFSMGACCTWSMFEHCLNEIAYFLPVSGDCWAIGRGKSAESAKHLADCVAKNKKTANDFKIYSGCGRSDIAERNLTPMVNEMKKYPDTFKYCDNFKDGNLYQVIYEQGGHTPETVMRVLYNGLPKMFD